MINPFNFLAFSLVFVCIVFWLVSLSFFHSSLLSSPSLILFRLLSESESFEGIHSFWRILSDKWYTHRQAPLLLVLNSQSTERKTYFICIKRLVGAILMLFSLSFITIIVIMMLIILIMVWYWNRVMDDYYYLLL